jgi:hypothetical protein
MLSSPAIWAGWRAERPGAAHSGPARPNVVRLGRNRQDAGRDSSTESHLTVNLGIIDFVGETAPTLAKLEAEIGTALIEHHDQLVHRIAVALVEIAVADHAARNGNGNGTTPKLCTICRARLAAKARTVCESCRKREQREPERLRKAHVAELERVAAGERGERAQAILLGERQSASSQAVDRRSYALT